MSAKTQKPKLQFNLLSTENKELNSHKKITINKLGIKL